MRIGFLSMISYRKLLHVRTLVHYFAFFSFFKCRICIMQYNNITTYINEMRVIAECITHSRTHLFLRRINSLREAKSFLKKPLDLTLSTLFYFWFKYGYLVSSLILTLPVFITIHSLPYIYSVFCTEVGGLLYTYASIVHCPVYTYPFFCPWVQISCLLLLCFLSLALRKFRAVATGEVQTERRHGLIRVPEWQVLFEWWHMASANAASPAGVDTLFSVLCELMLNLALGPSWV